MINKVILIGNLGADPEVNQTSTNTITNVSLATTRSWKDQNGQKQEVTDWHRVVFFNRLAEIAGDYLKKGSQIYIEGRIQTRKWQDGNGLDRYTTEIVADQMKMLGRRSLDAESKTEPAPSSKPPQIPEWNTDVPF